MKQHHQRVLRLWRCPECDRTVRLPGRVTSRTCLCMGEPTLMQLQETERFRKFDVDSFVSYQTEEDVTPTPAELVEEIPQHLMPVGPTEEEIAAKAAKPRRGKAYLRTEIDEHAKSEVKTAPPGSELDDFGAGIDDEITSSSSANEPDVDADLGKRKSQQGESTLKSESDGGGRKRKRRRRRRSGRRDGDAHKADGGKSDQPNDQSRDPSDVQPSSQLSPSSSGAAEQVPVEGNRTGKKRRRRRRRRSGGAGAANNGSENSAAKENDSAPPTEST